MKIKLNYSVQLLSDWHIGSGLDAGPHISALVAKTEDNLPYIPGKTIKGLLRDAVQDIAEVNQCSKVLIQQIFGERSSVRASDTRIHFSKEPDRYVTQASSAYFSSAYLAAQEQQEIITQGLHPYLYRSIASTRINNKGTAVKGSLRSMEVCIPVKLFGTITITEAAHQDILSDAAKLVRHLGVQRNRGLGRCRFSI